ncbi:DPM1 [Enterospora canceri]|uniref:Dolichol-phosphate mannosyltransferase subunit 1 n=1 Tax=Enterospora canceri TaxID=1081671 RepID=A0A1Y1S762_9MICR|nr:DPM1 [Enterospora canceri]
MYNVILPTYNESKNIICMVNMLIAIFRRLDAEFRLVVVDDNSPDETASRVKALNNPNIKVIEREGKLGLGSAYMDATKYCIHPYTIIIDVDLQQDPFDIIGMTKYCKEYDIVASTRYSKSLKYDGNKEVMASGKVCHWKFSRRLISSVSNSSGRFILDLKSSDLTSSFRIYKTEIFKNLIKKVSNKGFGFQFEILARAEYENYKIKEYPITFYNRAYGESKLGATDIYRFLVMLVYLYFFL